MARRAGINLSELTAVLDLCRKKGVIRLEIGELKLLMGPEQAKVAANGKTDPHAHKRGYYENLLNRVVLDEELKQYPDQV